jgi:hypothetical protein
VKTVVARFLIRVDTELAPELLAAFPDLETEVDPPHTVLVGDLRGRDELTSVLNRLGEIGVEVVDVVRVPG